MKNVVLVCLAFLVLLAGCKTSNNFAAYVDQPLKVSIYKSGQVDRERMILPSSPENRSLASWFVKHQTGWKKSWIAYAPQIRIAGTNLTVDVQSHSVIVNVAGTQYVRDVSDSDLGFLKHEPNI